MKTNFIVLVLATGLLACNNSRQAAGSSQAKLDMQGHRGSRGLMPENTIPAMTKALELGVTTLEMDVVISLDKQVVLSHDVYFHQNITTTPEGATLTKAEAEK